MRIKLASIMVDDQDLTIWSSPSNRMPIRQARPFRKRCSRKEFP